ncbi:MAG: isopentenyl transferase family protein, partial [Synergistota bacterium]|nr:isopentenyl transferase family protein [Synergistota bacterium]
METVIPCIIGPTAVGKTRTGIAMARAIGAEIVSVDSRQVYRGLDVGADKVSSEIRSEIPHHMLDISDPDETFTVADFTRECKCRIREIHARGSVALLVGGTPYYYESLFCGIPDHGSISDSTTRKCLESRGGE